MNWGKSIILAFALFAIFIGALVTVCVRQDINLVTREYYAEELRYGEQMERISNASMLSIKPIVSIEGGSINIRYEDFPKIDSCEVKFFRPSDARLDRIISLGRSVTNNQSIDISGLKPGLYKVRLTWSMSGKTYFMEEAIVI